MKTPTTMSAMDARSLELRQRMAERRLQLDTAVKALSRASSQELSVRHHLAEHPWGWIAGGALIGLWMGINRAAR